MGSLLLLLFLNEIVPDLEHSFFRFKVVEYLCVHLHILLKLLIELGVEGVVANPAGILAVAHLAPQLLIFFKQRTRDHQVQTLLHHLSQNSLPISLLPHLHCSL
jgi:hypothetical protein